MTSNPETSNTAEPEAEGEVTPFPWDAGVQMNRKPILDSDLPILMCQICSEEIQCKADQIFHERIHNHQCEKCSSRLKPVFDLENQVRKHDERNSTSLEINIWPNSFYVEITN